MIIGVSSFATDTGRKNASIGRKMPERCSCDGTLRLSLIASSSIFYDMDPQSVRKPWYQWNGLMLKLYKNASSYHSQIPYCYPTNNPRIPPALEGLMSTYKHVYWP